MTSKSSRESVLVVISLYDTLREEGTSAQVWGSNSTCDCKKSNQYNALSLFGVLYALSAAPNMWANMILIRIKVLVKSGVIISKYYNV